MTPEQKSHFQERGCLLLKGALARSRAEPLRSHVLAELKRLKIWSAGKTLSAPMKTLPPFQQINRISEHLKEHELARKIIDDELRADIAVLLESPVQSARGQGQFLVSLPNQGDWTLRGLNWHTDVSAATSRIPGVQVFALIDDVQPRGGATLAIAGSHRLAGQPRVSQSVREALRGGDDPGHELQKHGLSIIEMSGTAGDVYLMDMRVLHTPSINATKRVRMMVTVRYVL
jgi:hypothetical protein